MEDPPLSLCFREDLAVREAVEVLLAQVTGVVTARAQPVDDARRHTDIGEELDHGPIFRRVRLLRG